MSWWGKTDATLSSFFGRDLHPLLGAAVMPQSIWIFGITLVVVMFFIISFENGDRKRSMRAVACESPLAALTGIPV